MRYNANQLTELLSDKNFQNIGALPSQFHPYTSRYVPTPWDKLYIRPFEAPELKLISKAAVLKDMQHTIHAIDTVITQDARELTVGDFYYVLMWLRIHSMPKSPLIVDWTCQEQVLVNKETGRLIPNDETFERPEDHDKYDLRQCGTQNTLPVHMSMVEIHSLPEKRATQNEAGVWDDGFQDLPEGFDFPRALHIQDSLDSLENPEYKMLTSAIQWVAGATWDEKVKKIEDRENGMDLLDSGFALSDTIVHGVSETTQIQCRHCRFKQPYVVNISPMSFFR